MTSIVSFDTDSIKSPVVLDEQSQKSIESDFVPKIDPEYKTVSEIQLMYREYRDSGMAGCFDESDNEIDENAIRIDGFIQAGETEQIYKFCDLFERDTLQKILNATPRQMYHGNVLHSTLYSNIGKTAKELYVFFREHGAVPCLDYYKVLPWEQTGSIWTCIPKKNYSRNVDEFAEIYRWVKNYEQELEQTKEYQNYQTFLEDLVSEHTNQSNLLENKIITGTTHSHFTNICHCKYHRDQGSDSEYDSEYESNGHEEKCSYDLGGNYNFEEDQ